MVHPGGISGLRLLYSANIWLIKYWHILFLCYYSHTKPSFDHLHPKWLQHNWFQSLEGHTWHSTALQLLGPNCFSDWHTEWDQWISFREMAVVGVCKRACTCKEWDYRVEDGGSLCPTGARRPVSRPKMVTNGERCQQSALTSPA